MIDMKIRAEIGTNMFFAPFLRTVSAGSGVVSPAGADVRFYLIFFYFFLSPCGTVRIFHENKFYCAGATIASERNAGAVKVKSQGEG